MDNTAYLTFPIPDRDVETQTDPFVVRNGLRFAGTHLLIDLWGGRGMDDIEYVEHSLRRAAEACGATVLNVDLHRFQPTGVSGVAVLAESHISIHTWPENDYAAIDIFVCGKCDPYLAVPVLRQAFAPEKIQLAEHKRGLTE
ncbi:MAG: adenosylmethionine decarboxylase [Rhodospirillaceae bacterium]|nr:adenosylmethionine decarboxylase [Rhodospirillaceae bacterium]